MTTFKLIKSSPFDKNGVKGTAYTVALKGRALNLSTLSFADETADVIKVDDKAQTLSINCDIEIIKRPYVNALGDTLVGLSIMPKLGVDIAEV